MNQSIRVSFVYTNVGSITDHGSDKHSPFDLPPATVAERIAITLINEKLAFCANIIERVKSVYWHKGQIEGSDSFGEVILQVKTLTERVDAVMARLREIHPYEIPMIWSVDIDTVDPIAFPWISEAMTITEANQDDPVESVFGHND